MTNEKPDLDALYDRLCEIVRSGTSNRLWDDGHRLTQLHNTFAELRTLRAENAELREDNTISGHMHARMVREMAWAQTQRDSVRAENAELRGTLRNTMAERDFALVRVRELESALAIEHAAFEVFRVELAAARDVVTTARVWRDGGHARLSVSVPDYAIVQAIDAYDAATSKKGAEHGER